MTDDSIDGRIGFETDGRTLRIRDALEGEEFPIRFDREPQLQPALPGLFHVPVDRAVSFEAESISIPVEATVTVRDADGEFVAQLDDPMDLSRGTYYIDVAGSMKVLVRAADVAISATGMVDSEAVNLTFDRLATVTIGARSLHTRPEATITVPNDPTALADAVSVLGSSIKEFTAERSWPTLRGYPPRIRVGDELDIPSPLVAPDTGVEVVVRPTYADVYRLSTLAYYLGARVVIGDAPAIRLDNGYVEPLPTEGVALEERTEELLRTWFFLDTLVRTNGYVKSDRYEYEQVGSELPFYPPNLADRSMSERLMEYLEVDPETVEPYTPEWPTEAVLRPVPEAAELLPHLAHVLAPIRVRGSADPTVEAPVALATSPWMNLVDGDSGTGTVPTPDNVRVPAGTAVLTPGSYENRLTRTTTARGEIRVVVMTDSAERAEVLRRALSDPEVPGGLGSWDVIDDPGAEIVTKNLSDPEIDIAYCDLPIENDRIVAADGTVTLDEVGEAPALGVFEDAADPALGVTLVENGGLAAILVEVTLDPSLFRSLIGLLSSGVATAPSVGLSGVDAAAPTRLVGDPGVEIASHSNLTMNEVRAWSETSILHRLERGSVLSISVRFGVEQKLFFDAYHSMDELSGRMSIDGPTVNSSDLLRHLEQEDSIVRLNGQLLLPEDVETEADIEDLARRCLSGDSEPVDRICESRSE
ncbi:hypothetical protein FK85_30750 [Halorubrum saccharovorum]|uniref:Uncharacterized protein n=1 Tax=Halorubrum saccharovorum TaxID=2248 RepID=A0A0F8AUF0_9EURY|nr:hypothetical protein [Halorubrum saccharovorum]KKF39161.1 hypothetical protein FK85_30750 [Halorubrum saccharovorum]